MVGMTASLWDDSISEGCGAGLGHHSLPEAEELRDPSWQASPHHEGILHSLPEAKEPRDQCQSPRGGSAGLGKFHSLPEAMGPSGKAIVASCVQGPQGSVDCLNDFGGIDAGENAHRIARGNHRVHAHEHLRDSLSEPCNRETRRLST